MDKKDNIDKLDEEIEKISRELDTEDDNVDSQLVDVIEEENEEEQLHDTKEIENLKDVEEQQGTTPSEEEIPENENEVKEEELKNEVKEEVIQELEEKEEQEKTIENDKKKKKKKIIIIVSICSVLVIGIGLLLFFLLKGDKIDNEPTKLSSGQQKEIIEDYGEEVESVISKNLKEKKTILKYEEAIKLVKFDYKVVCKEHEVYEDGTIYINKCKIDNQSTAYSYGVKQPEKNVETLDINSSTVTSLDEIITKKITYDTDKLYRSGSYNISELTNKNLVSTLIKNINTSYIAYCITPDDALKSPVSYDQFNDIAKKYFLNEKVTSYTFTSLDKSTYAPAQYVYGTYGFILSNYGVQITGACGWEGIYENVENFKIVKAEKTDEYVYIYKKVAFGKVVTSDYDIKYNYYKDYNKLELAQKGLDYHGSGINWDLYHTYRYDFKIVGGNYYFQSAEYVE